jgi:thiosulfate/3-mercaptopyruvate sulfurtransferase
MVPQPVGRSIAVSGLDAWQNAHVPGSQYLNMFTELSAPTGSIAYGLPTAERVQSVMRRFGVNHDDTIVLYGSGYPGPVTRVWWVLKASGARDVRILDGGFEGWTAASLMVSEESVALEEGDFLAAAQPTMVASSVDIEKAINSRDTALVNALSPEQFSGRGGTHYGRPGRIPGSINVPFRSLLKEGTSWLRNLDEITKIFAAQGVLKKDKIINYCGGGIAASGTVFALHLIGRDDASLYDGSLIDWSADPTRPLVVDAS